MGVDAAAIIRTYCSNCMISAGSTSAGGAGTDSGTSGNLDSSMIDPGFGGQHYSSYDYAQKQVLIRWNAKGAKPDFVSWHPYTTWQEMTYKSSLRNGGAQYYIA